MLRNYTVARQNDRTRRRKDTKIHNKGAKKRDVFSLGFVPCLFHMVLWLIKKGVAKAMGPKAGQRFIGAFRQEGKNNLIGIF